MSHRIILALVAAMLALLMSSLNQGGLVSAGATEETPNLPTAASGSTLWFSGYQWDVRSGTGGPGPNNWDRANVWVDAQGALHLKLANQGGTWSCAEVSTRKRLGFGRYQFQVIGRIDQLDRNVVLGLFNYPTPDVGGDGTNEIDIEFARWGDQANPIGNYTVWPARAGLAERSHTFPFALTGTFTTHRFTWNSRQIFFQSLYGHRNDNRNQFASWVYKPAAYSKYIPQKPLPVHLNLWLYRGLPPTDGQTVEVIVKRFTFTPLAANSGH